MLAFYITRDITNMKTKIYSCYAATQKEWHDRQGHDTHSLLFDIGQHFVLHPSLLMCIQLFIDNGRTASFVTLILMFVSDTTGNLFQIILHHSSLKFISSRCFNIIGVV